MFSCGETPELSFDFSQPLTTTPSAKTMASKAIMSLIGISFPNDSRSCLIPGMPEGKRLPI